MNYHMNKLVSTLPELLNMFKTTEGALKKEKSLVLLVQYFRTSKMDKKNKGIIFKANKHTGSIKKDKSTCHHCGKEGHWRRDCKEYLAIMKTYKLNKAYTSCMFIIENYLTTLHCSS